MPTYLQRYSSGEHEQVWAELVALGSAVAGASLYPDALAVARETMTRVRKNAELVVSKLKTLDYVFEYPNRALAVPEPDIQEQIAQLERYAAGYIPLALRAFYEIVGSIDLTGNHPRLAYRPVGLYVTMSDMLAATGQTVESINRQNDKLNIPHTTLEEMEALWATARAKDIKLIKTPSARVDEKDLHRKVIKSDPLIVDSITVPSTEFTWAEDPEPDWEGDVFAAEVSVSGLSRPGARSAKFYFMPLGADLVSDAPLLNEENNTTFVNYLRAAFRWGGFPGLENDPLDDETKADIVLLTEGLVAF